MKGLQRGHFPTDVSYTRRFRRNHQLCAISNLVDPGLPCSASQSAAAVCNVAADISRPTHTDTHIRLSQKVALGADGDSQVYAGSHSSLFNYFVCRVVADGDGFALHLVFQAMAPGD